MSIEIAGLDATTEFISRKKHAKVEPKPKDRVAWKHNGSGDPERLLRSPVDSTWLTQEVYVDTLRELDRNLAPFTSSKSRTLVLNPENGEYAWLKTQPRRRRKRHIFLNGAWILFPRGQSSDGAGTHVPIRVGSTEVSSRGTDDGL